MSTIIGLLVGFVCWFLVRCLVAGLYSVNQNERAVVEEGTTHVYVLFGQVHRILREPGLYFLWAKLGLAGPVINLLGKRYILDLRLDQTYLHSQAIQSHIFSGTQTRADRSLPTSATQPSAA